MIPKYVSDALDERTLCYDIEHLPSAQKKGHWIEDEDGDGRHCSECGSDYCYLISRCEEYNFCPNCGADMRESSD